MYLTTRIVIKSGPIYETTYRYKLSLDGKVIAFHDSTELISTMEAQHKMLDSMLRSYWEGYDEMVPNDSKLKIVTKK